MSEGERDLKMLMALLRDHERGDVLVSRLSVRCEELIDALVSLDSVFAEELRELWLPIEIAYATALDRGEPQLSRDETDRLEVAVGHLREVAARRVART